MASYLTLLPLREKFTRGCLFSMFLYITVAEVPARFIYANKKIKGIEIGDHEIKITNFADNTTIFLRDIICLNRIQVILKLQASTQFPLKYLELTLVTLFLIAPNGTKYVKVQ